jgi:hypothetical protein
MLRVVISSVVGTGASVLPWSPVLLVC